MIIENSDNNIKIGMTFSEAISIFQKNGKKNLFEEIITINTIEEDENLSEDDKLKLISVLNSNEYTPFQKRIMIMRTLDKEKEFSSQIGIILRERLPKMEMVKRIMLVFRDYYTKKDVLKKEFGEVLTSVETVKNMIKEIDNDFWNNPYNEDGSIKRVLETSNGSGVFLWMVIYKFMVGLVSHFEDENDRYKFIIENMIYACELQKSKMFNWLCIADIYDEYDLNVYCGSFLSKNKGEYTSDLNGEFDRHMSEVWKLKPGDINLSISNPPYQEMDGGSNASAKPIYNLFTEKAIKISKEVLFITPSRWFAGGKGLSKFRQFMMESNKIKVIKHFDDVVKIFGKNVDIPGGVSYFIFDNNYNGDCLLNDNKINLKDFDIIITNNKMTSLISKLEKYDNLSKICMGRGDNTFNIQTNDSRVVNSKLDDNYIKCYMSKKKGFQKWINLNDVKTNEFLNKYKVVTAESNGDYPRFGNIFITNPFDVCSGSYIWFVSNSLQESESLLSYLKTNFANKLLSMRKISQHIKPDTLKWIPMVPFDREWTDVEIFEYFNLSEEEKKLILE